MNVLLRMPHRNSGARIVIVDKEQWFYSAEELVAYKNGTTKLRVIVTQTGETIRRHMHELGVMEWPAYSEVEFDLLVHKRSSP